MYGPTELVVTPPNSSELAVRLVERAIDLCAGNFLVASKIVRSVTDPTDPSDSAGGDESVRPHRSS